MPIEGFNYQDFAKNLAGQASQVVPPDFNEENKAFIVNTIYNFCCLSGEALVNDETLQIDANGAMLITQFIGEWTFHKSVDLIHGNIDPQFREGILQKVAFTVFEIAKQAIVKKLPQDQMIPLVEHHVLNCFKEAMEELKSKGALDESQLQNALNQSNIDQMAQTQAQNDVAGSQFSDAQILKLASVAMLLKNMSEEKINLYLSKFDPQVAQVLMQYLKMNDLESKIDKNITAKCLEEIKLTLPESKQVSPHKIVGRLQKIVKNSDKNKISVIMNNERSLVKKLIEASDESDFPVSTKIAGIILGHLEDACKI